MSRYGLVAFASSLDQIGPITQNVEDSALLLEAISGFDPKDSTSVDQAVPHYIEHLEGSMAGKTIGIPNEFFSPKNSASVKKALNSVILFYQEAGCNIKKVSIPTIEQAIPIYYVIATAEASSNLARYDGIRYGLRDQKATTLETTYIASRSKGFGKEVKRRILLGTYMLRSGYYESYYGQAQKIRKMMCDDFGTKLKECDVLLSPTMMNEVFRIGERATNPVDMYLSDAMTTASNLTGLPSLSIPCGNDEAGLPISFQLIANAFDETTLLHMGHLYQKENPAHHLQKIQSSTKIPLKKTIGDT